MKTFFKAIATEKGFEGEIPELKYDCDCRKPKPGMLINASDDFNIDLENSWMIGDGKNDVLAGIRAGCKTALIGIVEDVEPDIKTDSLLNAVNMILGN